MKRTIIYLVGTIAAIGTIYLSATQHQAHSNSSGAPGSGACTGCHSGSILNGENILFMELFDTAMNDLTDYIPGQTHFIAIGFDEDSNITKAGFAFSANAGTFSKFDDSDNSLQIRSGYVTHTSTGTNESAWFFKWDAPASATSVNFTLFMNEANGDNSTSGDRIYRLQRNFNALPTGSSKVFGKSGVHLFPNPAKEMLNISFELNKSQMFTLEIYSLEGKLVQQMHQYATSGLQQHQIELHQMKPGIYMVRIQADDELLSRKLIIQ